MVSLTNQARLLAAQEFNRRVIAQKIARGKRLSTSKSRIGVLTGVKPRVVQGKVVGLTTQKSKTRLTYQEQILTDKLHKEKEKDLAKLLHKKRHYKHSHKQEVYRHYKQEILEKELEVERELKLHHREIF